MDTCMACMQTHFAHFKKSRFARLVKNNNTDMLVSSTLSNKNSLKAPISYM